MINRHEDEYGMNQDQLPPRLGLLCALACYALWGVLPIYWKLLSYIPFFEIYAHRMFWSFVFMLAICALTRRADLRPYFRDRRALLLLGAAGVLVASTWGIYIYAVNSGQIVEASLGYYINPLLSIIAGVAVFREKLTRIQKAATALAAAGVIYFTWNHGVFPWISVALAVLFALYGAVKKKAGYPAVPALAVETALVAPIALIFIAATFILPGRAFLTSAGPWPPWGAIAGLMGGGVVTALPLLLFARAANVVPLSTIGFAQYLSPTLSLLIGVFIYGETFTAAHLVCFALIWAGLLLVSAEAVLQRS
ncbi:MAG: EamA family transporter RarD [Gracilibacteraceae bacterium]|jgi:chloramphenicol-sensitive protein RarD|nr:EamA family transporter RarD [Gracilibacteraceae bacterium]